MKSERSRGWSKKYRKNKTFSTFDGATNLGILTTKSFLKVSKSNTTKQTRHKLKSCCNRIVSAVQSVAKGCSRKCGCPKLVQFVVTVYRFNRPMDGRSLRISGNFAIKKRSSPIRLTTAGQEQYHRVLWRLWSQWLWGLLMLEAAWGSLWTERRTASYLLHRRFTVRTFCKEW